MEWPTANRRAIALGVGVSMEKIDTNDGPAIEAYCRRRGYEPREYEPILFLIVDVARARNAHIREILAEREPQRSLDLDEQGPAKPTRRTWTGYGMARIKREYAGGPRTRRQATP